MHGICTGRLPLQLQILRVPGLFCTYKLNARSEAPKSDESFPSRRLGLPVDSQGLRDLEAAPWTSLLGAAVFSSRRDVQCAEALINTARQARGFAHCCKSATCRCLMSYVGTASPSSSSGAGGAGKASDGAHGPARWGQRHVDHQRGTAPWAGLTEV